MNFKKKSKGLWYSDDGFFGAALLHAPGDEFTVDYNKKKYQVFFMIKDENDIIDPEDAVWAEDFTAKTQKAAVETAETYYSKFLGRFIEAAQSAKKKK